MSKPRDNDTAFRRFAVGVGIAFLVAVGAGFALDMIKPIGTVASILATGSLALASVVHNRDR